MKNDGLLQLFIYCILKANHEQCRIIFNSQEMVIDRGQFITGRDSLAKDLNQNGNTCYKRLKVLENLGICNIKSNNKFSLVTVVNYELYQMLDIESNSKSNNKVTTREQQSNTNKNIKNDKNEKNNNIIVANSIEFQLSSKLSSLILKNNHNAKVLPERFAVDIERMIRLDERKPEEIEKVIEYSQSNQFWKTNILSGKKLREKFDTLWMQMQGAKDTRPANTKNLSTHKFDQREQESDIDKYFMNM